MTRASRRTLRRHGAWLIDHGLKRLGVMFYDLARVDWETELDEIDNRRKGRTA